MMQNRRYDAATASEWHDLDSSIKPNQGLKIYILGAVLVVL